ncbi:short tail fiber protein [Vibrio phage 1.081.O._10N.286.52.C2]|nr:short tail fiber protein [Vibrio phage 1.081.O._10N.286.52.C2]
MSGTNIFTHASDAAQYVYLQPFTAPAKAFESGGDVQSLLEQINIAALAPFPVPEIATQTEYGAVGYATQTIANALDDVVLVVTPKKLAGVDTFVSPATATQRGLMREISSPELTRDFATSEATKLMSYRRIEEMLSVRTALTDDGQDSSSGFARFSTLSETLALSSSTIATPLRTWNLIQANVPEPWAQATETKNGVLRTLAESDAQKSDASIAISVGSIEYLNASTSKRGVFKLADVALDRTISTADEYIATAGNIDSFGATSTLAGVFKLPTGFVDDSTQALSAARGFELDDKLDVDGGTITGILKCDNITAVNKERIRQTWYNGSYYYDVVNNYEMFPNNQLNARVGLAGRPIGSIYHSTSSVNPSTIFGGTWTRISGGQTMMGQGQGSDGNTSRYFSAGAQGNNTVVKLVESNLHVHKHFGWGEAYGTTQGDCIRYDTYRGPYGPWLYCAEYEVDKYWQFGTSTTKNHVGSHSTDKDNYLYYNEPVGGDESHENMMPYYTVYIWRRIK